MTKPRPLTTDHGQLTTPPPASRGGGRRAFTLIELLVVMVIIAIIISFVVLAAMDAARRAEERATQSLITKLEGGLNDRLDALMSVRPDPNWSHGYLAAVWNNTYVSAPSLFVRKPTRSTPCSRQPSGRRSSRGKTT